jgi:Na+-transporting NADH:ubiquinone oxidoreductase subunit C
VAEINKEGITNILVVAIAVCLVCSIVVSTAAVALKPQQQANRELDRKQNILRAAGMLPQGETQDAEGRDVTELFGRFTVRAVNLDTGQYVDDVDVDAFDQVKSSKDESLSTALSNEDDIATIKRRENLGLVYLVETDGRIERVVLPIRGYGLWGTLFGYLALEGDLTTVSGIGFYEHKETPGLGGEVDNPSWKALWHGVEVFDERREVAVDLVKTRSPESSPSARHEVDALAGATLTTRGVENLVHFWLGDQGYGNYLTRLATEA